MSKPPYRPGTSSIWKWIGVPPGHEEKPSPKALADRERRVALGPRADLTGRLLGDPPPGRSALERRLEAERRRAMAAGVAAGQAAGVEQSPIEDLAAGDGGERGEA